MYFFGRGDLLFVQLFHRVIFVLRLQFPSKRQICKTCQSTPGTPSISKQPTYKWEIQDHRRVEHPPMTRGVSGWYCYWSYFWFKHNYQPNKIVKVSCYFNSNFKYNDTMLLTLLEIFLLVLVGQSGRSLQSMCEI